MFYRTRNATTKQIFKLLNFQIDILPLPKILQVLNPFKTLFKHTFIYGLATVLPRMLSFLLVPLYTKLFSDSEYGIITLVFSYIIFFNVILSYGMETTVFRFFTKQDQKTKSSARQHYLC